MSTISTRSNSFIIWFLLGSAVFNTMHGESMVVAASRDTTKVVVVGGEGEAVVVHPKIDVNYMSNRRVPKGPDPIHNRRASNSRRPPGKALR